MSRAAANRTTGRKTTCQVCLPNGASRRLTKGHPLPQRAVDDRIGVQALLIGPSLEEISTEMAGKVKITKVNIDDNPEIASQFGVRSIPTLMIFKGGEVADTKVGAAQDRAGALDQRQRRLTVQ
ncbi:hypothetical protein X759_35200 [Mesorhizobium sp. LSHC420B00]|nr:hypothetical protein X759_35200 [Mesorhizobium sp. LSHC420B00]